jgi:hypothetical protein
MQLFNCTAEDLEYHLQGALSPRQSAREIKKRRAQKRFLTAMGLTCLLGGGLAFGGVQSRSTDSASGVEMLVSAGISALLGAPLIF